MTTQLWRELEGREIDHAGRLGELLGASEESAVYALENGQWPSAAIRLRVAGGAGAALWLDRWRAARNLHHPHLLGLYSSGTCALDDIRMVYVVMERADETLAGVLRNSVLSEAEAREMLDPALSALRYLHANGFAHGSLQPSNVMACGEQLKLSSDTVSRVDGPAQQQEDLRALGLLVENALQHDMPEEWRAMLQPEIVTAAPPAAAIPAFAYSPGPIFRPGRRGVAYGLAAVLALFLVVAWLHHGNRQEPPKVAQVVVTPAVTAPVAPPATAEMRPPAPVAKPGGWAVVVATYGARPAAEKRAHSVTRKWPRFRAEVFQPAAERPFHMVVIGRGLSEDEAAALRRRAIASGLPRDTYIRRFGG